MGGLDGHCAKAGTSRSRARLASALGVSLLLGAAASRAESCLPTAGATERATTSTTTYVSRSARHAVDARGVVWTDVRGHAVRLEGDHATCFSGGAIRGPYPEDSVYACSPEHCPGGVCPAPCWAYHLSAGISVRVWANAVIEDVRISDYGDGISQEESADRADLEIRRAYLHDLHDDAVENDWGASLKVTDSLFERVNIAFASRQRSGTEIDARDRVVEVRNSLIQLHEFTHAYKQKPGRGGFWKWGHDGMDPRFAVTGNVFVAGPKSGGLLFPLVDQVVECSGNKLLWTGTPEAFEDALDAGDDSDGLDNRGRRVALSHCYAVTVKRASESQAAFLAKHWDPLVAEWKRTHPAAGGTGGPALAPTATPLPGDGADAPGSCGRRGASLSRPARRVPTTEVGP